MNIIELQKRDELLQNFCRLPIIESALRSLAEKIPQQLCYHSPAHTLDVLREVLTFGMLDRLSSRQLELLAVGAAFHDLGFIEKLTENELLGAEYAAQAMAETGAYTPQEIVDVRLMITDTRVQIGPNGPRQIASFNLSRYLLDADLSNLGRDDFFEKAELVRLEVGVPNQSFFYAGLLRFVSAHRWYTRPARELREAKKHENIRSLKDRLAAGRFG